VLSQTQVGPGDIALPDASLLALTQQEIPELAYRLIGTYLEAAQLLGRRTAEMHLSLASRPDDPVFGPVAFSPAYQRPLHQSMRNLTGRIMQLLRRRAKNLPDAIRPEAQQVLDQEAEILRRFHSLLEGKISARRTRTHGDYHLGQVLYTGKDFMIIDFEGEPARTLQERRVKRSPLQDVAGMLRSFHYAAYAAYFEQASQGVVQPKGQAGLEAWARYWHLWVSVAFLQTYLQVADSAAFMPETVDEVKILLDAYLLEKAVYELGYELNNRPDWVKIPLQGILQTL
jgi:maltose alpha-D-glucosyltransferase/alpha-amylase